MTQNQVGMGAGLGYDQGLLGSVVGDTRLRHCGPLHHSVHLPGDQPHTHTTYS